MAIRCHLSIWCWWSAAGSLVRVLARACALIAAAFFCNCCVLPVNAEWMVSSTAALICCGSHSPACALLCSLVFAASCRPRGCCMLWLQIHQLNSTWSESRKASYVRHAVREYTIHKALAHTNIVSLSDIFEVGFVQQQFEWDARTCPFVCATSTGRWGTPTSCRCLTSLRCLSCWHDDE